jgi:glutamate decarboxylase
MHVDAASGGFVAPFLEPELVWDFRVPRVQSINSSGHKYGLVYPGVGWAVWRDQQALPEDLVFHVDYLGGTMPTFALNFSRGGAQIVAQYYNMIRLGRAGYTRIQRQSRETARWLAEEIAGLGPYTLLSDGSQLPVFAFTLDGGAQDGHGFDVYDVSEALRLRGWIVPAYKMPPAIDDLSVLRICVRNGFTRDLAELLLGDLRTKTEHLQRMGPMPAPPEMPRASFHH